MIKPNYEGEGIANLMSSLTLALGGKPSLPILGGFDISRIKGKNVIFINIDGLGFEFLKKYGKKSFLWKNLVKKMTTVFPSTTASATTTLTTGKSPIEHGLTGWFMYLSEFGLSVMDLPFKTQCGDISLEQMGLSFSKVFPMKSFFSELKARSFLVREASYVNSPYTKEVGRGAKLVGFKNFNGLFLEMEKIIKKGKGIKFVSAYWDGFDSISHNQGISSEEAQKLFWKIDGKIQKFSHNMRKSNCVIIITADHGQIETRDQEKIILVSDHPDFKRTLSAPLAGDSRCAHCYVRSQKEKEFKKYVKKNFSKACLMRKSADLLKQGYFGLGKENIKIKDRIGDYILIMKEDYLIRDFIEGETGKIYIGNHGGLSKEEMLVPLIVIEC